MVWLSALFKVVHRIGLALAVGAATVKVVLFAGVFLLGPLIDNVFEPRFRASIPGPERPPSAAFAGARKQFLAVELLATGLFYAIIVPWTLG